MGTNKLPPIRNFLHSPNVELSAEQFALSRRTFLKCCSVLALSLSGCGTFFPNARFAHIFVSQPHPDDFLPILRDLIKTVLPFEHPEFPAVDVLTIETRVLDFFPIADAQRFLSLQKSLIFFNELDLFPHSFSPIIQEETKILQSTTDAVLGEKESSEKRLYLDFRALLDNGKNQFTELPLPLQRKYLYMWGQSNFTIKRQLYHSVKAITVISAYSTSELWKTIGYEGPLLEKP